MAVPDITVNNILRYYIQLTCSVGRQGLLVGIQLLYLTYIVLPLSHRRFSHAFARPSLLPNSVLGPFYYQFLMLALYIPTCSTTCACPCILAFTGHLLSRCAIRNFQVRSLPFLPSSCFLFSFRVIPLMHYLLFLLVSFSAC
jgi:hypothetical protein